MSLPCGSPPADLGEAELEELKRLLMGVYGFRQVAVELTVKARRPRRPCREPAGRRSGVRRQGRRRPPPARS